MENQIPKIIHQIWSNKYEELPEIFQDLGMTWKNYHPNWKYILWNDEQMNHFIHSFYPEYEESYNHFYFVSKYNPYILVSKLLRKIICKIIFYYKNEVLDLFQKYLIKLII